MRNSSKIKFGVGVLIWIGLIVFAAVGIRHSRSVSPHAVENLGTYLSAKRKSIDIVSPHHVVIGIGDPLFMKNDGVLEPVGMVTELGLDQTQLDAQKGTKPIRLAWVKKATVTFFSGSPAMSADAAVELYQTDQSPAWIAKTMLSPSMREQVSQLIVAAYNDHQKELIEQFRPVVKKTLVDSASLIRQNIIAELKRREDTVSSISQRYQNDVIQEELMPVIQAEVWPIVEEEASPLVEEIGQEVWREVSIWRFGWRFLYDKSPLPDKKLSQKEFDRFVKNKAVPIFESHLDDVIMVQKKMISRILANRKLKETVSDVAREFFSDSEVQLLIKDVLRVAVVDNSELRRSIEQTWRSGEAKRAMKMANGRLESTITRIGQSLFGSPNGKITDEFARVLRNRVLHKDDRWLVIKPGAAEETSPSDQPQQTLALTVASGEREFPISFGQHRELSEPDETSDSDE